MADKYDTPPEVKAYFANGRRSITDIAANDDFALTISFDNGDTRVYDMNTTLKGDVFAPFRDLSRFKEVYIDKRGCVAWDIDKDVDSEVHWANHVDLCPDSCYISGKAI